MKDNISNFTQEELREKIRNLRIEHRELDQNIVRYEQDPQIDHLLIRRLKKRKLLIKDTLQVLQSRLIPDLNA